MKTRHQVTEMIQFLQDQVIEIQFLQDKVRLLPSKEEVGGEEFSLTTRAKVFKYGLVNCRFIWKQVPLLQAKWMLG